MRVKESFLFLGEMKLKHILNPEVDLEIKDSRRNIIDSASYPEGRKGDRNNTGVWVRSGGRKALFFSEAERKTVNVR